MALSEETAVESETQNSAKTAESMARGYQKEFLMKAKEKNIIVCLETGCGKTLVAVLLLKELSFLYPTATPNIAIFLVPTIMLVEQQANVIEELSELKVGQYNGQHNGRKDHLMKWEEDVYDLQVLVMTPQILLNVLRHALVKMESIRVLIFDECHHCQKGHPYAQIMKEYYFKIEENCRPKILGMTASPIIRKGKSELQINHDIDALEHLLDSKVVMVDERKELDALVPKPNIRIIEYDGVYESHDKLKSLFLKCTKDCTIKEDILQSVDDVEQSRKKKRDFILKLHNELEYCIHELGLWFGRHIDLPMSCESEDSICFGDTEKLLHHERYPLNLSNKQHSKVVEDASLKLTVSSNDGETWDAIQDIDIQTHLKSIAKFFDEIYAKDDFNNLKFDNLKPDIVSNKVICLVNLLRKTRFPNQRCIIFVQRTVAAKALKNFLSHIFTSICCDYVTGRMRNSSKKKAVNEFRLGLTHLLIATNVAEEGLDIKDCNLVVQFDMPNTLRSYVQSRGRARLQGSNYVILKDRLNVSENNELDTLIQSEWIVKEKVLKGPPPTMNSSNFCEAFDTEIFRVPQTGATLSIDSSVGLLFRYCSTLPQYQSCVQRPKFTFIEELDGIICTIDLPPNAPIRCVVGKPSESKDVAKKSACFKACVMLHSQGELSDYLLPYSKKKTHELTNSPKHHKNLGRGAMLQETVVPAVWAVPLNMESSSIFNLHAYKISFSGDREYVSIALLLQFPLPETVTNLSLNLELRYRRSVTCKLEPLREVILDRQQIALAEAFQTILFAIVLDHDLVGPNIPQDSSRDEGWYLLLPMRSCQEDNGIDWNIVNKLSSYVHAEHSVAPEDSCFAVERLPFLNGEATIEQVHGLLVKTEWGKDLYCITGVLQELNAASPFPNPKYENYIDYFRKNYKYDIKHTGKPLLKARFLKTAQNFLQHRHIWKDGKGNVKTSSFQAKSYVELPSEICNIICSGLSDSLIDAACILPSFMERLQSLLVATQMRDYFSSRFPEGSLVSVEKVLEALTTEKCMEGFSLERLELLGDSFLKFAVSCSLFIRHNAAHEGFLTEQRKKMVCNALLFKLGSDHGLPRYIRDQLFDPEYWLAPCHPSKFTCDETKLQGLHGETWESKENTFCNKGHRWMKMKVVSDVVEALIGAYLEDAGEAATLAFMKFIGIDASTESDEKLIVQNKNEENVECERRLNIGAIEEFLSYRFKEKGLLIEAFTHASFSNDHSRCYQRLEFLGDSVLDFMITRYLYKKDYGSDAGTLTDMRSSIVSNESFARITVKHRLDKHLMHCSPELSKCVDEFIEYLRASESVEIGDWDGSRCPKVLSDIFESLAGAVFVDVGFDVDSTWQIFGPILEPLVASRKQLLHPVRELQELCQRYGFACSQEWCGEAPTMKFTFQVHVPSDSAADGNSRVTSTVTWKDKLSAKRQAAVAALSKLKELGFTHGSRRKKANARWDSSWPTSSLHVGLTRRQSIGESSSSSELSECKSDPVYETESRALGRAEDAVQAWEHGGRETCEVEDDSSRAATGSPIAFVGEESGREGWGTEDASKRGGEEEVSGGRGGGGEGRGGEGWEQWDCREAGGGGQELGAGEARARLNLICSKKRWKSPSFRCDKEEGPPHDKWFTVVVELLLPGVGLVECRGDPRQSLKAAKDSAAYELLQWLAQQCHPPPSPHHHQHAASSS